MVAINAFLLLVAAAIAGAAFFGQIGIGTLDPFLLWPVAVAIVIGAFSSSFWEGMSLLSDRFDIYVRVGIFAAIADMIVTATCAWLFGLRGAIMAMPASAAALVGAYAFLLSRDVIARQVLRHLSVDMPYAKRDNEPFVGIVVPEALRAHWTLVRLPDRNGLKHAIARLGCRIDFCHYDSDKTYYGRSFAYPLMWSALEPGGVFISDDIQDNMRFAEFVTEQGVEFAVTECAGKYVGICRKP
jgi:hypothetical protein